MTLLEHAHALGCEEIELAYRALRHNTDKTMSSAAQVALDQMAALPNSDYVIPEQTPDETAFGTGRRLDKQNVPQFGEGSLFKSEDLPA